MIHQKIRVSISRPAVTAVRRAGLAGCAIGLCLTGWMAASNEAMAQAPPSCTHDFSWSDPPARKPPDDICGLGNDPTDFHALSWQIFKFLVWPASQERGIPDRAKTISDKGPTTFESLKADWEIFLKDADPPADWTNFPHSAVPCSNHPEIERGALVLATFNEFGNVTESELGSNFLHVLVAQNQSYVRYQASFNKTVFDKIIVSQLYNGGVVGGVGAAPDGMPVPPDTLQDAGALTVKSAWIELPGPRPIDPSRFYVRQKAWVQNPGTHECRMADVGLVGLHIVYKSATRPQWLWSTFEHVDNVPEPTPEANRSYTFNDGTSTNMPGSPDPDFRIPPPPGRGPGAPPRPYQVQRLQPINTEVLNLNRIQQEKLRSLGSVWQNYKLVMTQWPETGHAPNRDVNHVGARPFCAGRTSATANTTMETFFQAPAECAVVGTCMGCHNGTRRTDFIWSIFLNKQKPPDMVAPDARSIAIKLLVELLQKLQTK
jgi:hypothetical protein